MADQRTRDAIAADYQAARDRGDAAAMRRYQNEEACFVLLAILERLAADARSFVHGVALKGGILMAGELRSARSSADIDATTGRGRRVDPDQVVEDLRRAGRAFGLRLESEPDRTLGGLIVRFRFDSLTDAGTAKLEVSIREDLVFAVRDALFDVSELGLQPFTLPAVTEVELVAEKLRTSFSELSQGTCSTFTSISSTRAGTSTHTTCDELWTRSSRSHATSDGDQTCGE